MSRTPPTSGRSSPTIATPSWRSSIPEGGIGSRLAAAACACTASTQFFISSRRVPR
eukprot:CAMPEP_0195583314 /NCGR_PEP_ID=MMETSP0814-20130614/23842_1 /TAXON_ID=97485 /ORGANISM="Prymnesium parvum, Strain Texoma1" /LENGTH=55 /DNA_ID=CAMNT_0040721095 /DNA_START=15 /DNA_END=182 /DNA_ORIENTATION=-